MKVYGRNNIFSGNIKSNVSEEFDKAQNIIAIDDISSYDASELDREISIIDRDSHAVLSFNEVGDDWEDSIDKGHPQDTEFTRVIDVNYTSMRHFDNADDDNYVSIHNTLFDFGSIGSPIDFVVDFILIDPDIDVFGTLIYNGQNTGPVDLEQNKNFLLTTSGSTLILDPNHQNDPTVIDNVDDDGYLVLRRPNLKSKFKLKQSHRYHVAIIRSGGTTYLAINGVIHDSAPSVEYYYLDDVKFGSGYYESGLVTRHIDRFRVTKGTDLGWTADFTPPDYDDIDGCDFVLNSNLDIDIKSNYNVTVTGIPFSIVDNVAISEYIYDSYRKIILNLNNTIGLNDYIWLILSEQTNIQEIEFTASFDIDLCFIQSSYQTAAINESVLGIVSTLIKYVNKYEPNKKITLFRIDDNWVQKDVSDVKLAIPIYTDIPVVDTIAQDSIFCTDTRLINSASPQNNIYMPTHIVNQSIFKEQVRALDLKNMPSDISIPGVVASRVFDTRLDFILRIPAEITATTNMYQTFIPWSSPNEDYDNRLFTTRMSEVSMGYVYRCGFSSYCRGRRTATSGVIPLNQYCLVSMMLQGLYAQNGYARVYSTIYNLETRAFVDNRVVRAQWYQDGHGTASVSVASEGPKILYAGSPIEILAFRRVLTDSFISDSKIEELNSISGFFNLLD